jgi:hypothetical protein
MSISLELRYPNLRSSGYLLTSPKTPNYNCVAWAAGETNRPWWPIPYDTAPYYWPLGEQDDESLEVFIECFKSLGYEICNDENFEILNNTKFDFTIDFIDSKRTLAKVVDYKTGKPKSRNAILGISSTTRYSKRWEGRRLMGRISVR